MINPDVLGNLQRIKGLVSSIPAGPNETFVNTTIGGGISGSTAENPCGTGVRPNYTMDNGPKGLECLAAFQFYWRVLLSEVRGLGTSFDNLCGYPSLNGTILDSNSCLIIRSSNEPGLLLVNPAAPPAPYVWPSQWTPYQREYAKPILLFRKPRGIPAFAEGCGEVLAAPILLVLDICGMNVTPPPPTTIPPDKYVQHPFSLPPYLWWTNPDGRRLRIPIHPFFPFDITTWEWPTGLGGNPVGPPLPGTPNEQLEIMENIVKCFQDFYDSVNDSFPGGGPYDWDMTNPCCSPENLTRMRLIKDLLWCLQRIRYGNSNCPLWTPAYLPSYGDVSFPGCDFPIDGPSAPGDMLERLSECYRAITENCERIRTQPNPNNP